MTATFPPGNDSIFWVVPHDNPTTSWDTLDTRTQTVVHNEVIKADARADAIARNLAARG